MLTPHLKGSLSLPWPDANGLQDQDQEGLWLGARERTPRDGCRSGWRAQFIAETIFLLCRRDKFPKAGREESRGWGPPHVGLKTDSVWGRR